MKQILYPVYSPTEMQRIERRRKLRRFEPLVVIPAFKFNINQTVAPFIITDRIKNTVNVRFAISSNRNKDISNIPYVVFSGKAIPVRIPVSDKNRFRINRAKAEFVMSQSAVQKYGKRLGKLHKIMKLWYMAQQLLQQKN